MQPEPKRCNSRQPRPETATTFFQKANCRNRYFALNGQLDLSQLATLSLASERLSKSIGERFLYRLAAGAVIGKQGTFIKLR